MADQEVALRPGSEPLTRDTEAAIAQFETTLRLNRASVGARRGLLRLFVESGRAARAYPLLRDELVEGSGWVDYRMTNPATKKIGLKTSWVVRVGDYILFVGAYKT